MPLPFSALPSRGVFVSDAEGVGEGRVQSAVPEWCRGPGVCQRFSATVQPNRGEWRSASDRTVPAGLDPHSGGQHGGLRAHSAALEDQQDAQ